MAPDENLEGLDFEDLRRHFHWRGVQEVKRHLALAVDAASATELDNCFLAVVIAIMVHGGHTDGQQPFGNLHDLFSNIRDPEFRGNYDVGKAEGMIDAVKDLLFDTVCFISSMSIFCRRAYRSLKRPPVWIV